MRVSGWRRSAAAGQIRVALGITSVGLGTVLAAEEKTSDRPRVTAISPITVSPGMTINLKIRGVKLSNATRVHFPTAPGVQVTIKEKKAAEVVAGFEAKDVGDTQLEAEVVFPPELPPGPLAFGVITPDGAAVGATVLVREAAQVETEKEPDNGFREAQPIELGRVILGMIKEDKDVDVFRFAGRARQKITVEISAQQRGSLLDSALTLFDAGGQLMATNDDSATSRDARIELELPVDGTYFLSVADAHDQGGKWHHYELQVKEATQ